MHPCHAETEEAEAQYWAMTEIPKDLPNILKPHPLLADIPDHLKDAKNYNKIQKAIIEAGMSKHSHADVGTWAGCKACQKKQGDRLLMMKSLGFKSKAHYMVWQKIHREISQRDKLR